MIKLCHDNILVKEIVKDSKAGVLTVRQDESSAYMYFEVLEMSEGAKFDLDLYDEDDKTDYSNVVLITHRVAKVPFIDNKYFIDAKDVIAVVDKEFMEGI